MLSTPDRSSLQGVSADCDCLESGLRMRQVMHCCQMVHKVLVQLTPSKACIPAPELVIGHLGQSAGAL